MMEIVFKICASAIICTVATVVVKQAKPEFAFTVRLCGIIGIIGSLIVSSLPILEYTKELLATDGVTDYSSVILSSLGIVIVTYICSAICRECGEGTIGDLVDTAGRISIMLICLPIVKNTVQAVISLTDL